MSTHKAKRAGPRLEDGTIPLARFAKEQGVTLRTAQRWAGAGMPVRSVNGERRVRPVEANTWVRAWQHERGRESAETPTEARERGRKLAAEASLKELELQERQRELVPLADYLEALERFVGGMAAVAAGQLQRFEKDIVRATTPADARKVTQELHVALMRGANEYADQLEAEATAAADEGGEAA